MVFDHADRKPYEFLCFFALREGSSAPTGVGRLRREPSLGGRPWPWPYRAGGGQGPAQGSRASLLACSS